MPRTGRPSSPHRCATGFEINKPDAHKANRTQPRTWVDVYVADPQKPAVGRWVPYDPNNGALHVLDYNIVPVYYSVRDVDLVRVSNSTDVATSYSIEGAFRVRRKSSRPTDVRPCRTARLLAAFPERTRYCNVEEQKIVAPDMELVRSRIHSAAAEGHRAADHQGEADGVHDFLSPPSRPQRRLAANAVRAPLKPGGRTGIWPRPRA